MITSSRYMIVLGDGWISITAIILIAANSVLCDMVISKSPDIQKTTEGQTASLVWTLTNPFGENDPFAQMTIHKHMYIADGSNTILKYVHGGDCVNSNNPHLSCIIEEYSVGFNISEVKEADAGTYVCEVFNNLTERRNGTIFIYRNPQTPLISGNTTTIESMQKVNFTCSASSQSLPADIKVHVPMLYKWTSNALHSANNNLVTVGPVDREDDGAFVICTAYEEGSPLMAETNITLDVEYPPRNTSSPLKMKGAALNTNFIFNVAISAKPFPIVTKSNVGFLSANQNVTHNVPDNVEIRTKPLKPYQKDVQVDIMSITENNYGTYHLTVQNIHGVYNTTFALRKQGPPDLPSAPSLVRATAVSLTIKWTAGFHGGSNQTFSVVYRSENSTEDVTLPVETPPGVSTGDVMEHKLKENINSDTDYTVVIGTENQFSNNTLTVSKRRDFKTKVLANFTTEPSFTRKDSFAHIMFTIRGPLTHIDITNCVSARQMCANESFSVTENSKQRERRNIIRKIKRDVENYDFDVSVPLVKEEAEEFYFQFSLFDGEDFLVMYNTTETFQTGHVDLYVIIAAVAGGVVLLIIIVIIIVMWRKGKLKKERPGSREGNGSPPRPSNEANTDRPKTDLETMEDINPYGMSARDQAGFLTQLNPYKNKTSASSANGNGDQKILEGSVDDINPYGMSIHDQSKGVTQLNPHVYKKHGPSREGNHTTESDKKSKMQVKDNKKYENFVSSEEQEGTALSQANPAYFQGGADGVTYADLAHISPAGRKTTPVQQQQHVRPTIVGDDNRTLYSQIDLQRTQQFNTK